MLAFSGEELSKGETNFVVIGIVVVIAVCLLVAAFFKRD